METASNSDTLPESTKPKRFRFGLKTLLVAVVVFSLLAFACSLAVRHYLQTGQQNRELNSLGGVPELGNWGEIIGVDFDPQFAMDQERILNDGDLEKLAGITTIQWLNLRDENVSDVGLLYLHELPNLKLVYLEGTSVTMDGIERLRNALPDCAVHAD